MDLDQLQSTMRTFELACTSVQVYGDPAAEAIISSLSHSIRPYRVCQFILEHSQVAMAQFQAAGALRDAAIREWVFLEDDDKRHLISFCLCFVFKYASSSEGYVISKVASVAAQLMKRGWLEFVAAVREAFFSEVKLAIIGSHGLGAQFAGIHFLESLVSEFSPSTSPAMGLPREYHYECKKLLELEYLMMFYCWAQDAAIGVSGRIVESHSAVPEVKVCTMALRFMHQILNWDFQNKSMMGNGAKQVMDLPVEVKRATNTSRLTECNLVQLGPSWRAVLISSGHVTWLLNLYNSLRHKFSCEGYWLDCPLAVSARKLIVQFCSLSGSLFPSDDGQTQRHHLMQLLCGIIDWVDPPGVVSKAIKEGKSESELLDGCRVLLSIATVTSPNVFDQLLRSIRPYGTLSLLSALMCEAITDQMENCTEEETWSWVARDILLDSWTTLLMPLDCIDSKALLPPEGITAAANLFTLIAESELKVASATAFNDDNESSYFHASIAAMDERLSTYGLIARAAADISVPLLIRLFSECCTRLHQGRGSSDPTQTLEELYSLLLITGHVLADEGEGETPLVPKAIQTQFSHIMETEKHPVVILSGSIIKFAEQCLDPELRASFFSPRLMEAVIWFLRRWSSTYLMPSEEYKEGKSSNAFVDGRFKEVQSQKALLDFCGDHNQGKAVLNIIVRISITSLISYPGEKNLQALTCFELLHGLVRRKSVCTHLITLDSWRDLANSFANEKTLFSLYGSYQRSLAQTLVRSATGMRDLEMSYQYVKYLTNHMTDYLAELSGRNDLKDVAQQPDIILLVSCLLERLRGVAIATEPRTQKAIYEIGLSAMNPVLRLLEVYKFESAVVYMLLRFVVDWVDGQISYLEARETAVAVSFCMSLIQLYSSQNIGKISLSRSKSICSEEDTERYKDIRALLQLLSSLCSKDLIDFSSEAIETQGTNISQVVYTGLHIVTPLISMDLLKYPKLCHDYFSLLSHMLGVYPEMAAQLNNEAFAHIVGTLDFGLHHQDVEAVDMSLQAVNALASYHYKERGAGKIGLGSRASASTDSAGNLQEGILSKFLRSLLQFLLFEDYSDDSVSSAADALLPLILCEQDLYQRLGHELIERQANPTFKLRLTNAFQSLTSSNGISSTLDRLNYQKFRKNLRAFLIEVRGFLRTV
ncbi:unnamed protein product [Cuscuta campestris]|uniref:Exportin-4 n=1 Tax=Cuscuta campestris TaxID=132261 RepID=A0A484LXG4_9ASTE|nr:unnamed protein product [Cuscuta campestris]